MNPSCNISNETELFAKLAKLCSSPGYIHAIAYFCFRDGTIRYSNEMKVEDILEQYSADHLSRSELSTIIGLNCKRQLNIQYPGPEIIQQYVDETEALLIQLHQVMLQPIEDILQKAKNNNSNPFANASVLREPIFYSGDSAYHFQFSDLSVKKYINDDDWFKKNKGYSIKQAQSIISAIGNIHNKNINNSLQSMFSNHPSKWTLLPAFIFSIKDVISEAQQDEMTVKSFINSFEVFCNVKSYEFGAISDFNPINAYPIIRIGDDECILFEYYNLVEAFYETPFFGS